MSRGEETWLASNDQGHQQVTKGDPHQSQNHGLQQDVQSPQPQDSEHQPTISPQPQSNNGSQSWIKDLRLRDENHQPHVKGHMPQSESPYPQDKGHGPKDKGHQSEDDCQPQGRGSQPEDEGNQPPDKGHGPHDQEHQLEKDCHLQSRVSQPEDEGHQQVSKGNQIHRQIQQPEGEGHQLANDNEDLGSRRTGFKPNTVAMVKSLRETDQKDRNWHHILRSKEPDTVSCHEELRAQMTGWKHRPVGEVKNLRDKNQKWDVNLFHIVRLNHGVYNSQRSMQYLSSAEKQDLVKKKSLLPRGEPSRSETPAREHQFEIAANSSILSVGSVEDSSYMTEECDDLVSDLRTPDAREQKDLNVSFGQCLTGEIDPKDMKAVEKMNGRTLKLPTEPTDAETHSLNSSGQEFYSDSATRDVRRKGQKQFPHVDSNIIREAQLYLYDGNKSPENLARDIESYDPEVTKSLSQDEHYVTGPAVKEDKSNVDSVLKKDSYDRVNTELRLPHDFDGSKGELVTEAEIYVRVKDPVNAEDDEETNSSKQLEQSQASAVQGHGMTGQRIAIQTTGTGNRITVERNRTAIIKNRITVKGNCTFNRQISSRSYGIKKITKLVPSYCRLLREAYESDVFYSRKGLKRSVIVVPTEDDKENAVVYEFVRLPRPPESHVINGIDVLKIVLPAGGDLWRKLINTCPVDTSMIIMFLHIHLSPPVRQRLETLCVIEAMEITKLFPVCDVRDCEKLLNKYRDIKKFFNLCVEESFSKAKTLVCPDCTNMYGSVAKKAIPFIDPTFLAVLSTECKKCENQSQYQKEITMADVMVYQNDLKSQEQGLIQSAIDRNLCITTSCEEQRSSDEKCDGTKTIKKTFPVPPIFLPINFNWVRSCAEDIVLENYVQVEKERYQLGGIVYHRGEHFMSRVRLPSSGDRDVWVQYPADEEGKLYHDTGHIFGATINYVYYVHMPVNAPTE